jgi:hypothetical protein
MSSSPLNNVSKPSRDQINAFRTDMFGRTKTSHGETIFDSAHRYKDNGDYSDTTSNGATVTFDANQSCALLNVSTTSGSEVTRESFKVFPYQPGKSLQVMQTFVFAPAKTNLRQRAGYFSRTNGHYLEQDGTNIYFVERSYSTGQLVETRVPQSQWNMDKLDGSGPSDVVLDLSKAQILFFEYEWLGVGSVRMGFAIDGYFIVAHQFNHANRIANTYITTASLPLRFEITNTGTTSSASTMHQICNSVISNGGYAHDESTIFTAWRDVSATVGTDRYPLVAMRMKDGRTDSVILPTYVDISASNAGEGGWALVKNPTAVNNGTWVTDPYNGNVEYNVTATSMSQDGIPMRRQFFSATNQSSAEQGTADLGSWDLQLGRTNSATPVSDVYVLSFRTMTGTMNVRALLGWHDLL